MGYMGKGTIGDTGYLLETDSLGTGIGLLERMFWRDVLQERYQSSVIHRPGMGFDTPMELIHPPVDRVI